MLTTVSLARLSGTFARRHAGSKTCSSQF